MHFGLRPSIKRAPSLANEAFNAFPCFLLPIVFVVVLVLHRKLAAFLEDLRAQVRHHALTHYAEALGKRKRRPAPQIAQHVSPMQSLQELGRQVQVQAKAKARSKRLLDSNAKDPRASKRQKEIETLRDDQCSLQRLVSTSFFVDAISGTVKGSGCAFLAGAKKVQKSGAVYMAQRFTNHAVWNTLVEQEKACLRLVCFIQVLGWLPEEDLGSFFLAFAGSLGPLRSTSFRSLPRVLSLGRFQNVQLRLSSGSMHNLGDACVEAAVGLKDVAAMLKLLHERFEEKVLQNSAWLLPKQVLEAMDTCFDLHKYLRQPTSSLGTARCEAFDTLAKYIQERWPHVFAESPPDRVFVKQYQQMLSHWWKKIHDVEHFWKQGLLQWEEVWRATHADAQFLVEGTREAFAVWHAAGSTHSSEAMCESIASQLKKFSATGCTAGRAITKTVLSEGNIMADSFILRAWSEIKQKVKFHCRRKRVRETQFNLGKGSKTLHNFFREHNKAKIWSFEKVRAISRLSNTKLSSARAWERKASHKLAEYG